MSVDSSRCCTSLHLNHLIGQSKNGLDHEVEGVQSLWEHCHLEDNEDKLKISKEKGKWEYLRVGSQSSRMEGLGFEPRYLTDLDPDI